jgi:hypothetical protein
MTRRSPRRRRFSTSADGYYAGSSSSVRGQQFERIHVARPHDREVPVVERRQLGLAQALHERQDGRIHEADAQIDVGAHQLPDSDIVSLAERDHIKLATANRLEQSRESVGSDLPAQEMIQLDQHRRYDNTPLAWQPKEPGTVFVILVGRVKRCDDWTGI